MTFTEEGSWKIGPDGMYDLVSKAGKLQLVWQDKCFMDLSPEDGDSPEDFVFDEADLRWMDCYKPWLAAAVQGKSDEREFFSTESEAREFLKGRASSDEPGSKVSYYLEHIDGSYYYEEGKGALKDKVDPSLFRICSDL